MKCGAELEGNVKFCKSCGHPVDGKKTAEIVNTAGGVTSKKPSHGGAKSSGGNGFLIAVLVFIIIALCGGGGYYYYHTQQVAAQEKEQKAAEEKAAAEEAAAKEAAAKEAEAKEAADKKQQMSAYAQSVVVELNKNEQALSSLASDINSGRYPKDRLLRFATNVSSQIEKGRNDAKSKNQVNDVTMINEVDDLFSIQNKRAACMSKGIQGDRDQYRIGGNFYDEYQNKMNAFKKKYEVK